ncbi:MAG: 4-alpha-glucanotransferase, partial [Spirochaetaceae bacterium]|nr:4-alpha-glucanotransferase [Spirochaetaceae bacterium]
MQYPDFTTPITGVVVPLSALKSRKSLGIGEFADLPLLGRWAVSSGIQLIQILPVNDTGFEHSPYSALSAFALHPVYARLEDFPEASSGNTPDMIQTLKSELETGSSPDILPGNINFNPVLSGKMHILRSMWKTAESTDIKSSERWAEQNPWVRNYALFSQLKEENQLKSWVEWKKHRNPDKKELSRLWRKRKKVAAFWVWLQWRLEQQFTTAAVELDSMGVALKGDIPILINEDSADLWADRSNFNLKFRAGAADGQNWGFPVYNWDYLRSENFRWWRDRLNQAGKFYHAYRIDHVLGFFRIWAVPEDDFSAWNGYFQPCEAVTRKELESLGFNSDRITWLSRAHFPGDELRNVFGTESTVVQNMLEQVGLEDLWRTRPDGPGEK